jgi:hypothetical protein
MNRRDGSPARSGELVIVGVGIKLAAHLSAEAEWHISHADKLFHLVADPASRHYMASLNATAESLHDELYLDGPRHLAYERMVERMLIAVRRGQRVVAAFYGHPCVYADPSRRAVQRARAEGLQATILPAISALDCLLADLVLDPADIGCQAYEATDLLVYAIEPDLACALVLWQVGIVGNFRQARAGALPRHRQILVDYLLRFYAADAMAVVYEAAQFATTDPIIQSVKIAALGAIELSPFATLFIPPTRARSPDARMLAALGLATPRTRLPSMFEPVSP